METMRVPVHVEHDTEAKLFSAYVPDIPGCGEGATEAEAIADLKESLRAYIEARGIEKAISCIRPRAQILELDLAEVTRG
jgi:predicted RNase H-like HicB family nuclease